MGLYVKRLLITLAGLVFSSCSLAPFSGPHTARSLGAGKAAASFGTLNNSYFIRAAAGVSPNVDVGYATEFGSAFTTSGFFAKASILNNDTGPSFAVTGGYGATETSDYIRAGGIASLAIDESFEVFLGGDANFVETTEEDVEFNEAIGNMKVLKEEFRYLLARAGFNVWFNPSMGLTVYGVHGYGEDIEWTGGPSYGGGLLLNF